MSAATARRIGCGLVAAGSIVVMVSLLLPWGLIGDGENVYILRGYGAPPADSSGWMVLGALDVEVTVLAALTVGVCAVVMRGGQVVPAVCLAGLCGALVVLAMYGLEYLSLPAADDPAPARTGAWLATGGAGVFLAGLAVLAWSVPLAGGTGLTTPGRALAGVGGLGLPLVALVRVDGSTLYQTSSVLDVASIVAAGLLLLALAACGRWSWPVWAVTVLCGYVAFTAVALPLESVVEDGGLSARSWLNLLVVAPAGLVGGALVAWQDPARRDLTTINSQDM